MSDDFAKQVSEYLKAKHDKQHVETQKALQDQQIIRSNAPERWKQLMRWMENFVEQANRESNKRSFNFNASTAESFTVVAFLEDRRPVLSAKFEADLNAIRYRIESGESQGSDLIFAGHLGNMGDTFRPTVTGTTFHFVDERDIPIGFEEMGMRMVKSLVGMPE